MWSGIREEISPAILAVATFLFVLALLLMAAVEWLRARGARGDSTAPLRYSDAAKEDR